MSPDDRSDSRDMSPGYVAGRHRVSPDRERTIRRDISRSRDDDSTRDRSVSPPRQPRNVPQNRQRTGSSQTPPGIPIEPMQGMEPALAVGGRLSRIARRGMPEPIGIELQVLRW